MSFARELGPAVGGWAGECTMALPALSRAGGGDFLFSVFAGDHESFSLCVCVGGWVGWVARGLMRSNAVWNLLLVAPRCWIGFVCTVGALYCMYVCMLCAAV